MHRRLIWIVLLGIVLAGCSGGGGDATPGTDALGGWDTVSDVGGASGPDSDAGTEAGTDAGTGSDSGSASGSGSDSGSGAGAAACGD